MSREGALLGTRVAVLAAEVADVDRYRRGRAYARQGAVLAAAVRDGVLVGEVQGSRPGAYEVEVKVRAHGGRGRGPVPSRYEVAVRCTCPDDAPVCKHAVAVLLSFAEMVAAEPELLVAWTGVPLDAPSTRDGVEPEVRNGDADHVHEFFGVRADAEASVRHLPALPAGDRPLPSGELAQLALDALDHARRALHALYG